MIAFRNMSGKATQKRGCRFSAQLMHTDCACRHALHNVMKIATADLPHYFVFARGAMILRLCIIRKIDFIYHLRRMQAHLPKFAHNSCLLARYPCAGY